MFTSEYKMLENKLMLALKNARKKTQYAKLQFNINMRFCTTFHKRKKIIVV